MSRLTPPVATSAVLSFAQHLVREAADLAIHHFRRVSISRKADGSEVTEADRAVELLLRDGLEKEFPSHAFLGEESADESNQASTAGFVWVADPIDGTAAFARGLPVWGVSLALLKGGDPVLGVFYNPLTREMFTAEGADSAQLNGARLTPLLADDVPVGKDTLLLGPSLFHREFTTTYPGKIRSLGSTAAHICYVASGAAEAALINEIAIWDIAAACHILERAGAQLTYLDGSRMRVSDLTDGKRLTRPAIAATPATAAHIASMLTFKGSAY